MRNTHSNVTPIVQSALNHLIQLKNTENNHALEIQTTIQNMVTYAEEIEGIEFEIQKLEESLSGEASSTNLEALDKQRVSLKNEVENMTNNIAKFSYSFDKNQKRLLELEAKYEAEMKKLDRTNQDVAVREKISIMHDILLNVQESYTASISETLAKEMTNTFFALLDSADRSMFDRVVIDSNFHIKLLDSTGVNRSQELSMGQGQIFTLSFILSLAKLASKGRQEIGFPLFMDTPFGRLSGKNRDNLIDQIPNLTNQWILLLTDTELTEVEKQRFEKFDRVGKIYELKLDGRETRSTELNKLNDIETRRV